MPRPWRADCVCKRSITSRVELGTRAEAAVHLSLQNQPSDPVTFYEVYSFARDKTTHSYCTSDRPGYPTNMPTCLSNASGTLLVTTLTILLISIASLVSGFT